MFEFLVLRPIEVCFTNEFIGFCYRPEAKNLSPIESYQAYDFTMLAAVPRFGFAVAGESFPHRSGSGLP